MAGDLRKVWLIELKATPSACGQAFRQAFSQRRPFWSPHRSKWDVDIVEWKRESGEPAIALAATMLGTSALKDLMESSAESAGSRIGFAIDDTDPATGRTTCQMLLLEGRRFSPLPGIAPIANSGILLRYMKDVEENLRGLDPNLQVSKTR